MSAGSAVMAVRVLWGATLLIAPQRVLELTQPDRPRSVVALRVLRVLGARHLVQTAVQLAGPAPVVQYLGAASDGLHALSGVGLAVLDRRWRRAALIDSVIATGFTVGTTSAAVTGGARR